MAQSNDSKLNNDTAKVRFGISSATLHIIAMLLMLCDHAWATVLGQYRFLNDIGRIAFPIFAFMIVEGVFHTRSLKKYILRMFIFAVISEVPFDLMAEGVVFYPFHQNVMWTFLIALLLLAFVEWARKFGKWWLTGLVSLLAVIVGFAAGFATFVDYFGFGVLVVFVFYFFHGKKWWCYIGQVVFLYWLFVEGLGGFYYDVNIFGYNLEIVQEGLALIALIPIWLYNGRKGYSAKWFQYFCYAFYPAHMLILFLIR